MRKLAALEAANCSTPPGRPPQDEPRNHGLFAQADGMEVLTDGTEIHLASVCLADAELRLGGADDLAFSALKAQYADVLGGAPPGMPLDCGMESSLRPATHCCRGPGQ